MAYCASFSTSVTRLSLISNIVILSMSSPTELGMATAGDAGTACLGSRAFSKIRTSVAAAIFLNTASQSPLAPWRKSRMLGYQGLFSRPSSQRQSGTLLSATKTGLPKAPARCAIAVSEVTMRSQFSMTAAQSMKESGPLSKSPMLSMANRPAGESTVIGACSFMRLRRRTSAIAASGAKQASGIDLCRLMNLLPCQAMPIRKPQEPIRSAHFAMRLWSGLRLRYRSRNRIETGSKVMRQAHKRALKIKILNRIGRFYEANGRR